MTVKFRINKHEIHLFTQGEFKVIHDRINDLQQNVEKLKEEVKKLKSK